MRASIVISDLYTLLCAFALVLLPATALGWLGLDDVSLANVFALILALPWSLAMQWSGDLGSWAAFLTLACCMALNLVIIRSIGGWWTNRKMKAARQADYSPRNSAKSASGAREVR